MKRILLLTLTILTYSCSSDSTSNEEQDGPDIVTDDPTENPIENPSNEIGYNLVTVDERDFVYYQVDIDKAGKLSAEINLNEEFGVDESTYAPDEIEGSHFTLYNRNRLKFWQKNLVNSKISKYDFNEDLVNLNAGIDMCFSSQDRFGALGNHIDGMGQGLYGVFYKGADGKLRLIDLGNGVYQIADFFGDYIVTKGQDYDIGKTRIVVIDTTKDEIVIDVPLELGTNFGATVLNDKLYILNADLNYLVYDMVTFEKIDEGTFSQYWYSEEGQRQVFNNRSEGSNVLTKVHYNFPSITYGPAIYNLDQDQFTHGLDKFLASSEFRDKLLGLEPNFSYFQGYDVDLDAKKVVISYALSDNGVGVPNPKGGILLVDFDGNILAQVKMEHAPDYVVIKN
ncbi:MAG: hypothetical protein R2819_15830 [Allomuricauda sp.]